ncbi:MAG: HU family DNA-binding protein [Bacteroidales bacterium]
MNKAELISAMASESGLSKTDTKKVLDAFISTVTNTLKSGDKISLVGFGTFAVSERAERTGINPSTKKAITIPAKKVAKFKPGAELANAVE